MNWIIIFFTTGAYSGYSPKAPGTAGSVVGCLLYLLVWKLDSVYYMGFTVVLSLLGVWASYKAEVIFQEKDSGKIVIDEICGVLLTLFLVPFSWINLLVGFFLFRLFDISKPIPSLERLPGGWGVMMDDIAAGVISNVLLHGFFYFMAR